MNRTALTAAICLTGLGGCLLAHAADESPTAPAAATRPRAVPVGSAHAESADDPPPPAASEVAQTGAPAKFSTTDKWLLAGYNNNELVYTIIVTNEDTRIIHCTALMHGWYYENGVKRPISDRQATTVFPNQPTQIGNWMDMDQQSGATYSVKCRPM